MPKDSNSFKLRFQYYKQTGKLPYKAGRVDEELATDAILSRQMPIEILQDPLGMQKRLDIARANAANVTAMLNQAQVGTKIDVSQLLQNYYADKEDTRRFMQRKREGEELADKIFGTAFDVATLYAPAAKLAFGVAKQVGKGIVGAAVRGAKNAAETLRYGALGVPRINSVIFKGNKVISPQITAENAASITPEQWTTVQDAAIARGDMAEAQRLRDLHFKVNAPNTKMIDTNGNPIHNYHGSPSKNITIFRENAKKIPFHGKNRIGIYFTENKKRAFEFAGTKRKVYDTYLNLKNPYRQSYRQTFLNNFKNLNPFKNKHYFTSEYITTADLSNTLKGYDGAITKGTENVALKSNQIKLADAVTYDDSGVRIPLGERDNFKLNDIRYGISADSSPYTLPEGTNTFKKYLYDQITQHSAKELIENGDQFRLWRDGQVVDMNTPDELKQIYYNSVLPRMRNMRVGWHGGLLRPTVKSNIDAALERGYTVYSKDIWDKSSSSMYAGFNNFNTGHIAVKQGSEDFALGHEYRHRLDKLLPKSSAESDILGGAYDIDFLKLSEYYPELKDVRMADEAVTTNFDARLLAIGKYHALNTDWKLLNKIIDKLSDDEIIDAVNNANGYGRRYILWLENNGKLDTSAARKAFADKHRDAMKFVGGFGIPAALSIPQLNK